VPGIILVVTAPSGTGKTTLLKKLLAADPRLKFSISYTTRQPRPGETPGQDYFFVSPAEFRRLKDQGVLVEWVEQFGYCYGTARDWVEQILAEGLDLVFDIETRGARSLKAAFPEAVLIFILPPSLAALESRLRGRGDLEPAELARRLEQGRAELQEVPWYDFLVVNDDLEQALGGLQAIVAAVRCRTSHLWPQLATRFAEEI
jgi:guanylate kinase